eukprot:gene13144-27796_t
MVKSYLEGYNVTIVAYGQTGSGKTFTMGTSDANMDVAKNQNQGLIPRLQLLSIFQKSHAFYFCQVKVSFLEIYGENIFNLLPTSNQGKDRPSLSIRENDQGIFLCIRTARKGGDITRRSSRIPASTIWTMQAITRAFPSLVGEKDILSREEVQEFINNVNKCIPDRVVGDVPTSRKIRLSIFSSPFINSFKNTTTTSSSVTVAVNNRLPPLPSPLSMSMSLSSQDIEESVQLVSRLIELNAEEKQIEVDQDILEKEEILSKLMDTVKSFAPMKQDYERLLTDIDKLDAEQKQLKLELEIAKKQAENFSNIEIIYEKLLTTNEYLGQIRQDRVQKESAFKVMQRGTQQAESLQRQLKKLKEERINIIKQQKTQNLESQIIQKENIKQINQFKVSDLKNQHQLNTLKYEVERKERLLALKSKEIGRMATKLKVSEKHIKSLINNQIKVVSTSLVKDNDEDNNNDKYNNDNDRQWY